MSNFELKLKTHESVGEDICHIHMHPLSSLILTVKEADGNGSFIHFNIDNTSFTLNKDSLKLLYRAFINDR